MALLLIVHRGRGRVATFARLGVIVVPMLAALTLRSYQAFSERGVLDWDETYYLSTAVTGADGRGLYPYVFGYGPMPILGGLGYAAYLYALVVKLFGPSILALRAVSLLAALVGLGCLWLVVRRWYGSGAAWMAAALAAASRLFAMSNSIRLDSLAFAWVAAGLLAVAAAFDRPDSRRRHLLAGLVFGLGLQVHLDTAVTAGACGLLYLVSRRFVPLAWYVGGWAIGVALFLVFNVLPDPDAFYKTTVAIRVDATSWYSRGTSSAVGSFLDPRILFAKESERYRILYRSVHWVELAVVFAAFAAALVRRTTADRRVLIISAGVVVLSAVLLNNAAPVYFIHVTPALLIPLAALFSHGLSYVERIETPRLKFSALVAFAVVASAIAAVNHSGIIRTAQSRADDSADAAFAERARALVGRNCEVAGDGDFYVRYFPDYPYFVSARPTEVAYAMIFHGTEDEAAYWALKQPEAVVMPGGPSDALAQHIAARQFTEAAPGVWLAPGGCTRH